MKLSSTQLDVLKAMQAGAWLYRQTGRYRRCSLRRKTVRETTVAALENAGYITVIEKAGLGRGNQGYYYQITSKGLDALAGKVSP